MLLQVKEFLIVTAPNYLIAIAMLVIGWILINIIVNVFKSTLTKRRVDPTLVPFVSSLLNAIMKVALVISVAAKVGIQTTSFVAILGAAGLAVGLALQGSLSNFAGGVFFC